MVVAEIFSNHTAKPANYWAPVVRTEAISPAHELQMEGDHRVSTV